MERLIVAKMESKPGEEERLTSLLATMVSHTRKEPGNIDYRVYRSVDGTGIVVWERYVDERAHHEHRESDHYQTYGPQIVACLAQPVAAFTLEPIPVPLAQGTPDVQAGR